MQKYRIEWLDAMRGFTMLLVVYAHINSYCYHAHINYFDSFFQLWRMPLFFMISGFLFYRKETFLSIHNMTETIIKKFRIQVISTVVFILLFIWIFKADASTMLLSTMKGGYWFTITLFEYFLFFILAHLVYKTLKKINIIMGGVAYCITVIYVISLSYSSTRFYIPDTVAEVLSFNKLNLFIYFCLGALSKQYLRKIPKVLGNKFFITMAMVMLLPVSYFLITSYELRNAFPYNLIMYYIAGILGCIVVIAFFYKHRSWFTSNTFCGHWLQYIGRRTLDIYLLHFFFLPTNLHFIGKFFSENPNPILEFFVSGSIVIMVIIISLTASGILRVSPTLSYWLFGTKSK